MQSTRPIEVLPTSVIEKIAAGEVVERPAAVLKELAENSIDAGATDLTITIENAGFSLIKITDNGCGMELDDLQKSMLRHATSKIRDADDLFSIGTFGFRGEALGSIAAVSRMSIISAATDEGLGYMLENEGGEISGEMRPSPHRRGTTVIIKDLFYNVPARKKFMKTRRGEHLAIVRMLEQLVIPFPSIRFSLKIDGKMVFDLPVVDGCRDRIAGVAGAKFASSLIECRGEMENMEVTVYVTPPELMRERPRFQCLYVNLRRINNDSVLYSVKEAFAQFLGHNQRPAFFCFLTIDPSRIDVNVHPTKQLIKFDNERALFSFVYSSVKNGISTSMVGPATLISEESEEITENSPERCSNESSSDYTKKSEPAMEIQTDMLSMVQETRPATQELENSDGIITETGDNHILLPFPASVQKEKDVDPIKDNTLQLSGDVREKMWDLIPCYQIHAMFILAQIKNGILLIDQHAAHERILFEQAMEKSEETRTTSQQLLFPIVLEFSPAEKEIIESGKEYFHRFGFEIEDFGGQAVSVSAIPAFIKDSMVASTIREIVRYLLEGRHPDEFNDPHRRFAAAFACGAAIKAGQKLTQEEMNALLNNLFSSGNPYTCPHGRPTLVRMSIEELSRRFLR